MALPHHERKIHNLHRSIDVSFQEEHSQLQYQVILPETPEGFSGVFGEYDLKATRSPHRMYQNGAEASGIGGCQKIE